MLSFLLFLCFKIIHISKKMRNFSEKKWKILNFSQLFKAFVSNNIFKGFSWVPFRSVCKADFSSFCLSLHYPYLNKIVEISVKVRNFSVLPNFLGFGLRIKDILLYYFGSFLHFFKVFSFLMFSFST